MKKISLLILLLSTLFSQDFDYNKITMVFPDKKLSFKENQKNYKNFKLQLTNLAESNPKDEMMHNDARHSIYQLE